MLKLAMSLDRLGQRDAACQAYSELGVRYPSPPAHVRDRVQSERQRVGCR
jgi:TolA-binding protein